MGLNVFVSVEASPKPSALRLPPTGDIIEGMGDEGRRTGNQDIRGPHGLKPILRGFVMNPKHEIRPGIADASKSEINWKYKCSNKPHVERGAKYFCVG